MYDHICLNCGEFSDKICSENDLAKCNLFCRKTKLEFILEIEGKADTLEIERPRLTNVSHFLERCLFISRKYKFTIYAKCLDKSIRINTNNTKEDVIKEFNKVFPLFKLDALEEISKILDDWANYTTPSQFRS
jgi:hypothetical protein